MPPPQPARSGSHREPLEALGLCGRFFGTPSYPHNRLVVAGPTLGTSHSVTYQQKGARAPQPFKNLVLTILVMRIGCTKSTHAYGFDSEARPAEIRATSRDPLMTSRQRHVKSLKVNICSGFPFLGTVKLDVIRATCTCPLTTTRATAKSCPALIPAY